MEKQERKPIMFDTSKEAWEKIGIYVTEQQYDDLRRINMFMGDEEHPMPVHYIMAVLKTMGLLPNKSPAESGTKEKLLKELLGEVAKYPEGYSLINSL